ncbi:preprotein translocase subunit SecE [Mycoplasmopsis cynos]|uniref:preprotein translocase subunit SecE n=1 Tax=Mycoplasmopsis cynos TaxID=171284 RepID=UPI002201AC39|nr:preprotein translocase subunit SecE [Mycoplasmopsis cynos]UWV92219.1 preprotein translocase subunit SecE [Mycoplasmopsis cynos]WAM04341.1 preprotein translocase subunit SecE [Mycoplasmopsis cynos]WAM07841.1 preprotein translocase subunit SecE [Mycoplasmopsis cynos]WQQ14899.1 preprotein translocase subunit SecE [Mycoplasmopsis cynos]WQQ15912.1 preprotein translocase subunit SecE [Mycoplasmopsis cynos]
MQENNLLNSSIHGLSKNKKPKKYWIRKVIKEIKRVRWPDFRTNKNNFLLTIVCAIIFTAFVSLVTYGFTQLWGVLDLK